MSFYIYCKRWVIAAVHSSTHRSSSLGTNDGYDDRLCRQSICVLAVSHLEIRSHCLYFLGPASFRDDNRILFMRVRDHPGTCLRS